MIGHSPVTCVAPSKAKHTFIATVSISDIPRVYKQYPNCIECIVMEESEKSYEDAPTLVSVYLHNKAIDWDSPNSGTESDGIYIYDLTPKYQQPSQLAAATEIKATRARRTKAEIEAAKEAAKPEPVLPDFRIAMEEVEEFCENAPMLTSSRLEAAITNRSTRTYLTKAEIESAKTVEPVLPDFCTNGQECNLPVAPTFEAVEPEVITSAATTTKARRFGRTVAPVEEVETTDDSNDSEVA